MTTTQHIAKGGFYHLNGLAKNPLVQNCSCGHTHPMKEDSGETDTSLGWRESTSKFEPLTKSEATQEIVFAFGSNRNVFAE